MAVLKEGERSVVQAASGVAKRSVGEALHM